METHRLGMMERLERQELDYIYKISLKNTIKLFIQYTKKLLLKFIHSRFFSYIQIQSTKSWIRIGLLYIISMISSEKNRDQQGVLLPSLSEITIMQMTDLQFSQAIWDFFNFFPSISILKKPSNRIILIRFQFLRKLYEGMWNMLIALL